MSLVLHCIQSNAGWKMQYSGGLRVIPRPRSKRRIVSQVRRIECFPKIWFEQTAFPLLHFYTKWSISPVFGAGATFFSRVILDSDSTIIEVSSWTDLRIFNRYLIDTSTAVLQMHQFEQKWVVSIFTLIYLSIF